MKNASEIQRERSEMIRKRILYDPEFHEIIEIDESASATQGKIPDNADKFEIKMINRNIEILGGKYETSDSVMTLLCNLCHEKWQAPAKKAVAFGCPACHQFKLVLDKHLRLWDRTKKIVRDKKGKIVQVPEINPEVVPTNKDQFLVKCHREHTFLTSHERLKRNSWCPLCHNQKGYKAKLTSKYVYKRNQSPEQKLFRLKQISELKNSCIVDAVPQEEEYTLMCKTCGHPSKRTARQVCDNKYLCDARCKAGNKYKLSDME